LSIAFRGLLTAWQALYDSDFGFHLASGSNVVLMRRAIQQMRRSICDCLAFQKQYCRCGGKGSSAANVSKGSRDYQVC
jgi:hypothetical protein